MSTRQGEVSLRVGYTFFVKETTRMLVDIPGTLSPFQNASLTVVGGDTTERLTLYLNKTQLTLVLVCQRAFSLSLCQRDNENARWHTRHLEPCQRDKEKSLWGWDIHFFVKETTRMLVDIPGTLSHVNETRRSLFEGGIYIFYCKSTL